METKNTQPKPYHWATQEIIKAITENYNSDASIHELYGEGSTPQSISDPKFQTEIDALFRSGHELIAHTQTTGDDGGPCYSAYLVKPKYIKHYYNFLDLHMLHSEARYYPHNLACLRYAMEFPKNCLEIWAGPY